LKISDLTIWPMLQPQAAAASAAVRVESGMTADGDRQTEPVGGVLHLLCGGGKGCHGRRSPVAQSVHR